MALFQKHPASYFGDPRTSLAGLGIGQQLAWPPHEARGFIGVLPDAGVLNAA